MTGRIVLAACLLLWAWPADAQISFISSANSATTSVTLGTHQAGDAICIAAYRVTDQTAPVGPADYQSFNYYTKFGDNNAIRTGCKIAASGSEVSGTWTSATRMVALVYRGVKLANGGGGGGTATGSATLIWDHDSGLAMQVTNGTSWLVGCGGANEAENIDSAVAGLTYRESSTTGTGEMACHDTNAGVSSFTDTTTTLDVSGKWASQMFELEAATGISSRALVGVGR